MTHYVDVSALNFRNAPNTSSTSKLGTLFLCHPVEIVAEADASGFCKVKTQFNNNPQFEGFVSRKFLRAAVSDTREALVAQAIEQWTRFQRGLGKETVDPFFKFVGEMWEAIEIHLNGRDTDQPWSAAAISFMVRKAGPKYASFKFAAAHSRYIHDSIKRRESSDQTSPFWGFRLAEHRPQIGDLVCRWRERPIDFDTARVRDAFKSHCDIVVQIDTVNNTAMAIGGNVAQSVSVTTYELEPGDFLAERNQVFAVLANRTD
jgi:hypothetical protein